MRRSRRDDQRRRSTPRGRETTVSRLAVAVVALFLAVATSARAADRPPLSPSARATLERGLRSYAVGDWSAAIAAFRDGYQREPHPDFLYALAQAQRMSGDCATAVATYRAFLRTEPAERQAAPARANLARCEEQLAAEQERERERERQRAAAATPPPTPPPPAPPIEPPPRPRWWRAPAGGALVGVGLALAATGAALWGAGERDIAAINAAATYDERARLLPGADRAEGLRTGGIVTVSVGAVALLGGVIRWGVVARRSR
jgi:tetratricopeptide (TPR) repeat protein